MNDFCFDLDIILKTLDIPAQYLARETGLEPASVSGWLKGTYLPDPRSMETVYGYAYRQGLRINEAHEGPYRDLCEKNGLKLLFHGAREPFREEADICHSKQNNDLGTGFYCGETFLQSAGFVSGYRGSCVYSYGLDLKGLKVYEYEMGLEWALMIAANRGLLDRYRGSSVLKGVLSGPKGSDVMIAPIANNRMFDIIAEFSEGMISGNACVHLLAALDLGRQYVIKTDRAMKRMGLLRQFYLCREEKESDLERMRNSQRERYEKSSDFRSRYREGQYIEEILYE